MTTTSLLDRLPRPEADEMRIPEFDLADRMRKSMELTNVSVGDMAEAFGVGRETISRWIHGKTRPKRNILWMWAAGCGVDLQWLETGTPSAEALALAQSRAAETAQAATPEGDGLNVVHLPGLEPGTRCLTAWPSVAADSVNDRLTANRRGPILRVVRSVAA